MLRASEVTTSTASGGGPGSGLLDRGLSGTVALSGALGLLVYDLGGRLGCPVGVELRVVA